MFFYQNILIILLFKKKSDLLLFKGNLMFFKKGVYLSLYALVFHVFAFAQDIQYISPYKYPSPFINNISSIAKDTRGFIWLSTQGGIFRFDGKTFKNVLVNDHQSGNLESLAAKTILINPLSNLALAIITDKGLAGLDINSNQFIFHQIDLAGAGEQKQVLSISVHNGRYIITTVKGIYCFNIEWSQKNNSFTAKLLAKHEYIEPLLFCKVSESSFAIIDKLNQFYIYGLKDNGDIFLIKKKSFNFLPASTNEFFSIYFQNNQFYLATNAGFFIFSFPGNNIQSIKSYLLSHVIYNIVFNRANDCYVAANNGVYKLSASGFLTELRNNSTILNDEILSSVYSMNFDGEYLWLGSQNGLASLKDTANAFFNIKNTHSNNRNLNHVYNLGFTNTGELLISGENGLFELSHINEVSTISDSATYFLNFIGPDGYQIVSGLDKTYFLKNKNLTPIEKKYSEFNTLKYLSFNDYEYINENYILLSTENEKGVFIWSFKEKRLERLESYLHLPIAISQTNCLYKNQDKLFILTDSVFFEYSDNSLRRLQLTDKTTGRSFGLLFDMIEVNGYYYFTSYDNGVVKTDTAFNFLKIYNSASGLSNNGVYRILSVGDTALFISTNNGLSVLDLKNETIHILDAENGLHGNVFEEFSALKKGNYLYFGGKDGVSVIDVANLSFSHKKNNLYFIDYKIVDKNNIVSKTDILGIDIIVIPNTITQTTVEFQNVIFPFNSKNKYAYKINELHKNWIDLGGTNFVTLIGLSPGKYHLQIKAANEDGIWSDPKELVLEFLPKWYQTWLFKLLVLLTTAGIIYAFYRYRINQIKKQHQIRKNIATDLHDDLGSTLNSVKVFTNLAINGVNKNESLQQIKDNLNEATIGLRDMIWVLDDSLDSVDELVTRLKQFALPVATASNIETVVKADSDVNSIKLTKEEKRNLFLVCKEVINNSIKYAEASKINVSVFPSGKKINISIADNGKGFDAAQVKKGYGLKNMQYRASQVKYKVILSSVIGSGTQVDIMPA
ncbi:hypothetical protein BH11BAC4_BH11BAC4_16770 [soil metagenome]